MSASRTSLAQRLAWLPSPWLLSLWTLWWLWRYGAASQLPGYNQLAWPTTAGYLVDALILDSMLALVRWRSGDVTLRTGDHAKPKIAVGLLSAVLFAAAFARAVDGLHCHLAHSHMDAQFWGTVLSGDQLWHLRYLWAGALATGLLARALVVRDMAQAARTRARLSPDGRKRWLHIEVLRAAVTGCVGVWITAVAHGAAQGLVVPAEWWAVASLVEWLAGGG
ncbi:MAG: hypothetical protein KC502_01965 [Myxococcales bacterium]|nr:hypothetical protein [Myxococcales bacterium]